MFRFVSLFALVAVGLAEPEADPQLLYNHVAGVPGVPGVNTYAAYAVNPLVPLVNTYATPVVKPVDPHHTEGMTKKGVPEKTDSVKIAEKQHEISQIYENSKVVYNAGVYSPYTVGGVYNPYTVGGVYNPYTHGVVGYKTPYTIHHLGKREADSDADAQYFYHGYRYPSAYNVPEKTDSVKIAEKQQEIAQIHENAKPQYVAPHYAYSGYAGVYNPYTVGGVYSPYTIHHLGKREADSDADAQYFYHGYRYPSAYSYGYNPYPYVYTTPYAYGARSVYGYHY